MTKKAFPILPEVHQKFLEVSRLIGGTPLHRIRGVYEKPGVEIFAKLEWQQLGGSVKARPAFQIIQDAALRGLLGHGRRLLDASSGNTGIAYATIGAALGIPVTICLPENASLERKSILKAHGAEIILTSRFEGTDGAQKVAKELAAAHPEKYFYADQYNNQANWKSHEGTTALEIWEQTQGNITHFAAGLGTTGTFTGTGRGLRKKNPGIRLIAFQPNNPMHGLEGWKHLETAKVPGIFDPQIADYTLEIDTLEAYDMVRQLAQKEGLLVSPSAAANLVGAIKIAETIPQGTIVTTFADSAEKYSEVLNLIFS